MHIISLPQLPILYRSESRRRHRRTMGLYIVLVNIIIDKKINTIWNSINYLPKCFLFTQRTRSSDRNPFVQENLPCTKFNLDAITQQRESLSYPGSEVILWFSMSDKRWGGGLRGNLMGETHFNSVACKCAVKGNVHTYSKVHRMNVISQVHWNCIRVYVCV